MVGFHHYRCGERHRKATALNSLPKGSCNRLRSERKPFFPWLMKSVQPAGSKAEGFTVNVTNQSQINRRWSPW